ncbi:MAG: DUF4398 domain-containing protein [Gammaproteobacteria bacterium]|nr:DUF4398 domain-containing protein [Gammaproteobacteria bacterium]
MDDKIMKSISKLRWSRSMSGIGLAAVLIGGCASVPAPTEQLAVSQQAVSSAASAGGNEYASADMRAAQDKLDRAIQAMAEKDYENARLLAEQAEVDAQLAASKAGSAKAQQAAATVVEDSRVLRQEIDRK